MENEDQFQIVRNRRSRLRGPGSRVLTRTIQIPIDRVGIVIGVGKSNLRRLEHESQTRGDEGRMLNHPPGPIQAEYRVHIPSYIVSHLIGRNGVHVDKIMEQTGAYVEIVALDRENKILYITGDEDQIASAKEMIERLKRNIPLPVQPSPSTRQW